ncbi:BMC domain-containing protein [Gracilibacillus alcaliphilus]|uniref:BMC domain-containing protein n=1 Tax=Gracilibacillus alcaliphilus TaxID=1401441 RepID=UPI00195B3C07|nr:BMC domain-containing protein [Gracilibacillus alcaliphilus]MBM7677020.1 microcompartment protein CcmL/EutN [Gracilibacillus alcaliphilus]
MKHYEAIGVIETQYFAVAMEMLDQAVKTSDVEFLSSQNSLGGKLVSIIVGGSIADVQLAVEQAKQVNNHKQGQPLKNAVVITNPHPEILKYVVPEPKPKPRKRVNKKTTNTRNNIENKEETKDE